MKRILSVMLVAVMLLALISCGATDPSAKIQSYIDANKSELLDAMEKSFAESSGMTCTSSVEVEGAGFIISININELNELDESVKTQMQTAYDSMDSTFEGMLSDLQEDVPEVEYFEIRVCEVDGDLIATIHAGK